MRDSIHAVAPPSAPPQLTSTILMQRSRSASTAKKATSVAASQTSGFLTFFIGTYLAYYVVAINNIRVHDVDIMGTKNNPGSYNCHANAHPDEPMFVLLGRDPAAAAIVRLWTALRERLGEKDRAMLAEATACSTEMEAWARSLGKDPNAATRELSSLILGGPRRETCAKCRVRPITTANSPVCDDCAAGLILGRRTCCNTLYSEATHAPGCSAVGSPCPGCSRRRGDTNVPKCYLC